MSATLAVVPGGMRLVPLAGGGVFVHSPIAYGRGSEAGGTGELRRRFRGLG